MEKLESDKRAEERAFETIFKKVDFLKDSRKYRIGIAWVQDGEVRRHGSKAVLSNVVVTSESGSFADDNKRKLLLPDKYDESVCDQTVDWLRIRITNVCWYEAQGQPKYHKWTASTKPKWWHPAIPFKGGPNTGLQRQHDACRVHFLRILMYYNIPVLGKRVTLEDTHPYLEELWRLNPGARPAVIPQDPLVVAVNPDQPLPAAVNPGELLVPPIDQPLLPLHPVVDPNLPLDPHQPLPPVGDQPVLPLNPAVDPNLPLDPHQLLPPVGDQPVLPLNPAVDSNLPPNPNVPMAGANSTFDMAPLIQQSIHDPHSTFDTTMQLLQGNEVDPDELSDSLQDINVHDLRALTGMASDNGTVEIPSLIENIEPGHSSTPDVTPASSPVPVSSILAEAGRVLNETYVRPADNIFDHRNHIPGTSRNQIPVPSISPAATEPNLPLAPTDPNLPSSAHNVYDHRSHIPGPASSDIPGAKQKLEKGKKSKAKGLAKMKKRLAVDMDDQEMEKENKSKRRATRTRNIKTPLRFKKSE